MIHSILSLMVPQFTIRLRLITTFKFFLGVANARNVWKELLRQLETVIEAQFHFQAEVKDPMILPELVTFGT